MRRALLALAMVLCIPGCAVLTKVLGGAAAPIEQAAVDIAVASAVGTDKTTQAARAKQIAAVATQLLAIDDGSQVTITVLEAALNAKIIALGLPPADQAAAQLLTAAITTAISAELANVTNGAITPTTQVAIATVLGWVITAANAYAGPV